MKPRIKELFPEIEQIKDEKLRAKVVSTWEEAIEKGDWRIEELETIPFTLLIPECGIDLVTHTRAVTQTALKVAGVLLEFYREKVKINFDLLIAGGILHDVGKLLEYAKHKGQGDQEQNRKAFEASFFRLGFSIQTWVARRGYSHDCYPCQGRRRRVPLGRGNDHSLCGLHKF